MYYPTTGLLYIAFKKLLNCRRLIFVFSKAITKSSNYGHLFKANNVEMFPDLLKEQQKRLNCTRHLM